MIMKAAARENPGDDAQEDPAYGIDQQAGQKRNDGDCRRKGRECADMADAPTSRWEKMQPSTKPVAQAVPRRPSDVGEKPSAVPRIGSSRP
jgi:hypothetical protein